MKRLILLSIVSILFFPNILHSQCAPTYPGYISVGDFDGHNYYLSTDNAKPTDAQAAAEALGGYLAVIDNEEEDDFIFQNINELTYIGLNDAATEGTFEWFNGDPVSYTNIDPCNFCNSNSEDQDYVVKEPWGAGGWSFSNFWNARKYIVEIPCGTFPTGLQVDCDLNIDPNDLQVEPSDPSGNIVNWTPPTATTDCPGGIVSIEQISGQSSGSFFIAWTTFDHIVVYKITDACGNEEICVNEFEVNGIYGGIICPDDITVEATSADGAIVNFGLPTITPSTCIPGVPDQVSGLPSGSVFPIGITEIQFVSFFGGSNTYCQNGIPCSFTVTVNPPNTGGGCPGDFAGFTTLGEFGDSKYYISNDVSRPVDAQTVAESNGGYLAAISSQAENDFIQQNISDMVYIGLNDYDSEGNLEWFNGETFTFDNINPCGFCNENSDEMDFVIMAPWNGEWSFSNFWNQRKYVMEVPCGNNPGGNVCGFIKSKEIYPPANLYGLSNLDIAEIDGNYEVEMEFSGNNGPNGFYETWEISPEGETISESVQNRPPIGGLAGKSFDKTHLYTLLENGLDLVLTAVNFDGSIIWSQTIPIVTNDPDFDDLSSYRLLADETGINIYGGFHFGMAATWRTFVIRTDLQGNVLFQKNHAVIPDYPSIGIYGKSSDGGLYLFRRTGGATGVLTKTNSVGDVVWEKNIIGDLVSNRIRFIGETPDGTAVYLGIQEQYNAAIVRKYSTSSGDLIWSNTISNTFTNIFGSGVNFPGGTVTEDGGVVAGFSYNEIPGFNNYYEYGRLDAEGNIVWWHNLPDGLKGAKAFESTSDGGFIFMTTTSKGPLVIKMNEDGTFDPACGMNTEKPDLSLNNLLGWDYYQQIGNTVSFDVNINNNTLTEVTGSYKMDAYFQEYIGVNPGTEYYVGSYTYNNTGYGITTVTENLLIPNIPIGNYKLILKIDAADVVDEFFEINNNFSGNIFNIEASSGNLPDLTLSNLTNLTNSGNINEVVSFNFDLNNIGTITASGNYNINMYISTDDIFSSDDILAGEIPTGDTPVGTIANVPGAITVPNLSNGNYFLIIVADALEEIEESDENNNTLTATFEIGSGGGGCPTSLTGFTALGEFDGSVYFLSDDVSRPVDAQALAEGLGGNLATIDSQAENDFLFPQLGELVYIGLNDYDSENTLEWFSGDPTSFTNFDICGFCNPNSNEMDFVVMHSWNGGWSWSNFYNSRKYIVEIPCSSTLTDPNIGNSFARQNSNQLDLERLMVEKVHPNPARDFIFATIQSPIDQEVEVQIFDARGTLMKNITIHLQKGKNVNRISISDLAGGFYSIYISNAQGKNSTKRFVKIRG